MKNTHRLITMLLVTVLIFRLAVPVSASTSPIRIRIDGEFVIIPSDDQLPVIVENRTLVPLRVVMEALGFDVYWDDETRVVRLENEVAVLMLPMRDTQQEKGFPINGTMHRHGNLYVANTLDGNGNLIQGAIIPLDAPPRLINNRTMVPVRAISEATGMTVEWDGANRIVDIQTGEAQTAAPPTQPEETPEPQPPTEQNVGGIPRSAIILPDRRLTDSEMAAWQEEYAELGGVNEFELEVVRLVNIERAEHGVSPLTIDPKLMMAARFKAQSMADQDYMSHTGVYGAPWELMRVFGVKPRSAAENVARGQSTPEAVVRAWMNSDGHRRNILSERYHVIGVGAYANENGRLFWAQMFNS